MLAGRRDRVWLARGEVVHEPPRAEQADAADRDRAGVRTNTRCHVRGPGD